MPAARYWRAVGLQSVGGGALELSALHLYFGGARVDAAATLTSTFAPASGTLAALQDDDTATTARWLDVSAPGFALVWDFGIGNAQEVRAVRLGAGALYAEWLETLTLQYSSDGVSWATFGSVPAFSWPGAETMREVPQVDDPHFDKVISLLHFDGDLTDETGRVWSQSGTPTIGGVGRFGGCITFSGNSSERVSSSHPAFGTDDWTVEMWVKFNSTGGQQNFFENLNSAGINPAGRFTIYQRDNTLRIFINSADRINIPTPSTSVWNHISVSCESGIVRLFVNGEVIGSWNSGGLNFDQTLTSFGAGFGTDSLFGAIDELRITKGVARYTANFTPPTLPFADGTVGAVVAPPIQRAPSPERARIAASSTVPPHSTLSAPRLLTARNVEFAGSGTASATGTIYGSTAIKGTPNAPVRAKVSLLRARDLMLVRQTWSDPTTGAYAFHGLDPFEKYTTLAEYPTGDYRAVAADQLTPDIEEARAP